MVDTKTPAPVSAKPQPKTVQQHSMQAVFGLLVHPYTETRFNTDKPLAHELDGWCQSQIDGGKLVIV